MGTAAYPVFPAEYLTDRTGWLPNQNTDGQPEGCTNYSQSKLARILGVDPTVATPQAVESVTHANALGGFSVLGSIDAIISKLGWFKWRFVIQATGMLDLFDACRLAQVNGIEEQRAISIGSPWFSSWEQAALSGTKILPMPTAAELLQVKNNPTSLPWHNYVADGFSQNFPNSNGVLLYRIDSWQGAVDYLYLERATFNVVMDLYGTVQAVPTNIQPPQTKLVSIPEWFASLMKTWKGWVYYQ
jgi:hypothetical protein